VEHLTEMLGAFLVAKISDVQEETFFELSGLLKIWLSRAKAWDSKRFFYIGISIEGLNDLWPLTNIFDLWKLKI